MFIAQLVTTRTKFNVLWTSRDIRMKFSDFISNGWVIKIFLFFDIDAGLLVSLVYGLQIQALKCLRA